jgi:hypothetical protein
MLLLLFLLPRKVKDNKKNKAPRFETCGAVFGHGQI